MTYLYLAVVACPSCEETARFVEEFERAVPLDQNVSIAPPYCPFCGEHLPGIPAEWDLWEEAEVERVEPTDPAQIKGESA